MNIKIFIDQAVLSKERWEGNSYPVTDANFQDENSLQGENCNNGEKCTSFISEIKDIKYTVNTV